MFFSLSPSSRVWGRRADSLVRVFQGEELAGLLPPGALVDAVTIRPATGSDSLRIEQVRRANRDWLSPWEATLPPGSTELPPTWREYARAMDKSMRDSTGMLVAIDVDGEVAGSVSVGAVQHGAMSQGVLGYWIGERFAGRGLTSVAVAAVIDLMILDLGLHRLEINVRPNNDPSLGLCRRLSLRREGFKPRYMSIAGDWADHVAFAVDSEDLRELTMIESLLLSRQKDLGAQAM